MAFEACTYYLFHPFAMERIAADFPDIKLVAMLRDPVERAYSAYKHELARGFETEADFDRALELEDERLDGEIERMRPTPTTRASPTATTPTSAAVSTPSSSPACSSRSPPASST